MDYRREYVVRLPLPLAQLYSRAFNAKDARSRHDNAFYLFEATIKLAAVTPVTCYVREIQQRGPRVGELDRLLLQLALPSLGQWVAILRELSRHFGRRADAASHPFGHLWAQITEKRSDRSGLLTLYRRIKKGADGQPAGEKTCSILDVLDALVQYRNSVFGHGGPRFESFFEKEMGPLLLPAANDLLEEGAFEFLGPRGSRLVYLTDLQTIEEDKVEVGLRELVGLATERMAPLRLSRQESQALLPNRTAVLWPGVSFPLRLDPLLLYRESETAEEILFLNRDRNQRQVEYLSYASGRTERDKSTIPEMCRLLSTLAGREIGDRDLEQLAEQTAVETPSLEALAPPTSAVGQRQGDYEILAEIGRGGMGVVYLARQLALGRLVALKMLPADLAGDAVALARFRREIQHLARCEHPNIVKVLSSGTMPDGRLYYTMEYVPGCDLEMVWRELGGGADAGFSTSKLGQTTWAKAVLSASRKRREKTTPRRESALSDPKLPAFPLPPLPELPSSGDDPGGYVRRVCELIRDAALALQAVHDQKLVHRDVKPGNLMLTPDGSRIVLMDFGLVKGESLALTASRSAGFLGTLRYAAPEQMAAAKIQVGPPADVRGLGCVFWEMLTGQRLFGECQDEAALATKVLQAEVPRLRTIDRAFDRDLEAIVARATERRLEDRVSSAGQFANLIRLYLDGEPLPIRPSVGPRRIIRWCSKNALVALLLLTISLLIYSTFLAKAGFAPFAGVSSADSHYRDSSLVHDRPLVQGVTDLTITFGTSTSYSGMNKDVGQNVVFGIRTAFDAVNDEGGINGKKLKLIVLDDGYEPDRTSANMRDLFEKRKVFAIMGNVGSATAEVAVPYALSHRLLFFAPCTGAAFLRRVPPDRYVFNYRAGSAKESMVLVNYFVKVRRVPANRIAVFSQNDAYGEEVFQAVAGALRVYGVHTEDILRAGYERNTLKVSEAVDKFVENRKRVDAIIMGPTYGAAVEFVKGLKDHKMNFALAAVSRVGGTSLTTLFQAIGPQYGEGMIVSQVVPHFQSAATGVIRYRELLHKYHPEAEPGFQSLEGFLAASCLVEGIKRTGPDLTTEKLIDALESIRDLDLGIGPTISFGPLRHQASNKVWGTVLDRQSQFQNLDLE